MVLSVLGPLAAEHIALRVNDHKPQPQAEPRHWAHNFIAACQNILIPSGPNTNHELPPEQSMMAPYLGEERQGRAQKKTPGGQKEWDAGISFN